MNKINTNHWPILSYYPKGVVVATKTRDVEVNSNLVTLKSWVPANSKGSYLNHAFVYIYVPVSTLMAAYHLLPSPIGDIVLNLHGTRVLSFSYRW